MKFEITFTDRGGIIGLLQNSCIGILFIIFFVLGILWMIFTYPFYLIYLIIKMFFKSGENA